jgi:hypothetical protein
MVTMRLNDFDAGSMISMQRNVFDVGSMIFDAAQ